MHYALPALVAATLAALAPAQAQPTAAPDGSRAPAPAAEPGLQGAAPEERMRLWRPRRPIEPVAQIHATATPVATPVVSPVVVPVPTPAIKPVVAPAAAAAEPAPASAVRPRRAVEPAVETLAQSTTAPPSSQAPPPPMRPSAPAMGTRSGSRPAAPDAAGASNGGLLRPCTSVSVDEPTQLTLGKSRVVQLPFPVARLIVGGQPGSRAGRPAGSEPAPQSAAGGAPAAPAAAVPPSEGMHGVAETDVTLLSPTELFFLGRRAGSMNVVLQGQDGRCLVKDIVVTVDPDTLQGMLTALLPEERNVKVRGAGNALVLTGNVSNAIMLDQVLSVARMYGPSNQLVNMLGVTAPQQVMLEVTIAEVSKTLLDRFGIDFTRLVTSANGVRSGIISGIVGGAPGVIGRFNPNIAGGAISGAAAGAAGSDIAAAVGQVTTTSRGATLLGLDLENRDGVIRVLAEPNIMAISGQSASFLSGGKIFIPVAQNRDGGGLTITLEEKEFGVGLKFTPTVLDGRINLKVVSEVSELSQTGTPFTTVGNFTAVLPSMATRRVDTTVQLGDGQSFVVAGLIKNNVTEALSKFPGLGEAPVLGALFRSTEFQNDQTELMFVVTPRLVKPITTAVTLPTDNHVVPSRADVILRGAGEGPDSARKAPPQSAPPAPAAPVPAPAPAPSRAPTSGAAPAPIAAPPADKPVPTRAVSMLGRGGLPLMAP